MSDIIYSSKARLINQFWKENTTIHFYNSRRELQKGEENTRVFVAGSDQIWNPAYVKNYLYYLQFASSNAKLFSYAVSLASDVIDFTAENFYRNRLNEFSGLSVREETGRKLLKKCVEKDIRVDLDPVFLKTRAFWEAFASDRFKDEQYVFLYVVKPNLNLCKKIRETCKKYGLKVYYIGDFSAQKAGLRDMNDASVEDFVSLIKYARCIVTNSFHATAFSIILNKYFFTYVPPLSGSRIIDLLDTFSLQNQIINDDNEVDSLTGFFELKEKIDYLDINKKIQRLREDSIGYLKSIAGVEKCI